MNGLSLFLLVCCFFLAHLFFKDYQVENSGSLYRVILREQHCDSVTISVSANHKRASNNVTWEKTVQLLSMPLFVNPRYDSASQEYYDFEAWMKIANQTRSSPIRLSLSFLPPEKSFTVVLTEDGNSISTKFNNTIRLLRLYGVRYKVTTVVFTNSSAISRFVKEMGLNVQPVRHFNCYGFPELKWLLIEARAHYPANQYIFINSDILINPFIFHMARQLDSLLARRQSHYLLASNVFKTPSIPTLDFSSMGRFVQSYQSLFGYRRAKVAIDLFVFDRAYPFEELNDVVVGRFYVDSEVMRYSHVHQMPVVDLSFLRSFHQGLIVSNELKGVVDPKNLEYNRPLLGKFSVNDTILSSSLFVM